MDLSDGSNHSGRQLCHQNDQKNRSGESCFDDPAFVAVADRVFASLVKHSAMTVIGILEKIGKRFPPKLIPQTAGSSPIMPCCIPSTTCRRPL